MGVSQPSRERPGVQVLFGCGRDFLHGASKSWRTECAPFQRWVMTLDLDAETQLISIVLSCPALRDHGASSSWPARDMVGHLPRRLVSNSAADGYTAVCSRTVDDCAAGLHQAFSGLVHESLSTWAARRVIKPSVCETRVSCSGSWTTACGPHALGGAQRGEQRRPSLRHIKTGRPWGHTAAASTMVAAHQTLTWRSFGTSRAAWMVCRRPLSTCSSDGQLFARELTGKRRVNCPRPTGTLCTS